MHSSVHSASSHTGFLQITNVRSGQLSDVKFRSFRPAPGVSIKVIR